MVILTLTGKGSPPKTNDPPAESAAHASRARGRAETAPGYTRFGRRRRLGRAVTQRWVEKAAPDVARHPYKPAGA